MKTLGDKSKVDPQRKVAWSVTMRWFYGWLFVAVTLALLVLRGYFGALKHWLMA